MNLSSGMVSVLSGGLTKAGKGGSLTPLPLSPRTARGMVDRDLLFESDSDRTLIGVNHH